MRSEFGVKKTGTRMPYKRSLGHRHTFCIKLENLENSAKSIFSHLPVP